MTTIALLLSYPFDMPLECTKLMAVMSLGVKCGEEITVNVEGEDEDTACEGIKSFMEATM